MLISFSVTNFKTFREKAELSLIASKYDKTRTEENLHSCEKYDINLLKSAVVYGANASGKSKLMEALGFMRRFVLTSSKDSQKGEQINVDPFLLSTETNSKPSEFEIIFYHQKELFRYGFEVDKNKVLSEWLYYRPATKEIELFVRQGQQFDVHSRKFSKGLTLAKGKMIRENALMLSVAAQFNDINAGKAIDWFKGFKIISALEPEGYKGYSMKSLNESSKKIKILEMLHSADMSISDLNLQTLDVQDLSKKMPENLRNIIIKKVSEEKKEFLALNTTHSVYDKNLNQAQPISFDMENDESSGTNQFFGLTGPIIDVIEKGYVLAVDELDSKLHPNLVLKIVEIFNSKELNPNNAQLIFNTHDTNLLSADVFRRDQIWFVEKDRYGAAKLYSLSDFKEVRRDENFENSYIQGKYGAIPLVSEFENLLNPKTVKTENHGRK